jgi:hypothetical protein
MSVLSGKERGKRETAVRIVRSLYPVAVGTGVLIHRHIETRRYGAGSPGRVTCMNFLVRTPKHKKALTKEESYRYHTHANHLASYEKGEGIDYSQLDTPKHEAWESAISGDPYRTGVEIDRCAALSFARFLPVTMRPDHTYTSADATRVLEIKTRWAKDYTSSVRDDGTPLADTNGSIAQGGMQAYTVCTDLAKDVAGMVLCNTRVPYEPNPTYVVHELYETRVHADDALDRLKLALGVVQSPRDMMVHCLKDLATSTARNARIKEICSDGSLTGSTDDYLADNYYGDTLTALYPDLTAAGGELGALRVKNSATAPRDLEPDSERFTATSPRNFDYRQEDRANKDYKCMCFTCMPLRVERSLDPAFLATAFDDDNRLPGVRLRGTFVQRGTSVAQTSREVSHATGGVWRVVCAFIESDMNVPLFASGAADT